MLPDSLRENATILNQVISLRGHRANEHRNCTRFNFLGMVIHTVNSDLKRSQVQGQLEVHSGILSHEN